MVLERPELFSRRDFLLFSFFCLLLFGVSLFNEYRDYSRLTTFDDALIDAVVSNQYLKSKGKRRYTVMKLKSSDGASFYTTASEQLRDLTGYPLQLRIRTDRLIYTEYLQGFYVSSRIIKVGRERSGRIGFASEIASRHDIRYESQIYAALFTASPMDKELRQKLAALGVSHLMAISGFHLGVLSFVLFIALKYPFVWMQERFFPYVNRRRELFFVVVTFLFGYLVFLDYVPSLLRAFAMMIVGFVLYDRGIKVLSMQTLLIAVMLLLALWPRLMFALGFWLSVGGVFWILLFLQHFSHWNKTIQFIGIHIWVYMMMLPVSLYLFETFSLMHPLSIILSMLFILFYPLVLFVHVIGFEVHIQGILNLLLNLADVSSVTLPGWVVVFQMAVAFSLFFRAKSLWLLSVVVCTVFVSAVYQVA
jgi:competence protein ComEC